MTDDPFDGLNPITGSETPPKNVTDMAEYKNRPRQAHARQVNSSDRKSRFFVAADLASKPVPPRDWLVPDLIPAGTVTLPVTAIESQPVLICPSPDNISHRSRRCRIGRRSALIRKLPSPVASSTVPVAVALPGWTVRPA